MPLYSLCRKKIYIIEPQIIFERALSRQTYKAVSAILADKPRFGSLGILIRL